jgi:Domain of unknown function (DUF4440)
MIAEALALTRAAEIRNQRSPFEAFPRMRISRFLTRVIGGVFLAAITLAAPAQDRATQATDTARILSLENAWNGAELHHDVGSLELLVGDTFVYTDADGTFLNRSQWLAHVKSEAEEFDQLTNTGMTVMVYDNTAVVTGEYKEKIDLSGKMTVRTGRFTDTWIRRKGEWKCVASQSTLRTP